MKTVRGRRHRQSVVYSAPGPARISRTVIHRGCTRTSHSWTRSQRTQKDQGWVPCQRRILCTQRPWPTRGHRPPRRMTGNHCGLPAAECQERTQRSPHRPCCGDSLPKPDTSHSRSDHRLADYQQRKRRSHCRRSTPQTHSPRTRGARRSAVSQQRKRRTLDPCWICASHRSRCSECNSLLPTPRTARCLARNRCTADHPESTVQGMCHMLSVVYSAPGPARISRTVIHRSCTKMNHQ